MNIPEQKELLLLMQEALEEGNREDCKVVQVMELITERMQEMYREKVHSS
ncbi:hypothetical protein [Bacillus thermotolerans]|uniref:Uncharacterized protein n=1 Tax=Bacillus thermotolerans TaxID=1221996 RepID=A0A0F5HL77_BACTR|nr:hypothetical protein [Bacillus thermotolerans]KKB34041.1 hypothetical protein QY97_02643 [Bacillus thermotolerans]KKB34382.1 hypothetical protein QY96_00233 [Bacillus thermotolerans]KKB41496.1 hypothetical protein QY95_00640 [Bacillus thermotolerans]